jgi:glycosyltransferase involved in cell wall biosynthesis
MKPRVVYWTNIPAPYMIDRFNAVSNRNNVDFHVWFSGRTNNQRRWVVDETSWSFPYTYLPRIRIGSRRLALPLPLLGKDPPDVLVGLHAEPAFFVSHEFARRRGVRTAIWLTVTFDTWVERRRWKEAIKRMMLPRVDALLTTGEDGAALARRYGVRSERIRVLPHNIDTQRLTLLFQRLEGERLRLRRELGIRGVAFLYVGRLLRGKGLDYLLEAFAGVARRIPAETTLVLAGTGGDEARLRRRCHEDELNVVFTGFREGADLARVYAAADVFVFPTLGDAFGHVVEEAMAFELPVISTSAAGEIGWRIDEGRDGFIVPAADSHALEERMETLARDEVLRKEMGRAGAKRVAGHKVDNWAQAFEQAIREVCEYSG